MGTEFLAGLAIGIVLASIVSVVFIGAARKAARAKAAAAVPVPAPPPDGGTEHVERRKTSPEMAKSHTRHSGNTMIIEETNVFRDQQIEKSMQGVRDLLLGLADVIVSTQKASGRATTAFTSAKDIIHNLDSGQPRGLADAQRVLVGEIDRILQSNADLHSELNRANQGITKQREQIEELRVQARIDALTRIPNRAALDEHLKEYIGLWRRSQLSFCLLLLDIDHFKNVNDEHGHVNGDRILRGVASRIVASVRGNDFPARFGGEEFAVLLPGTRLTEAMIVAERIRQDVGKTKFKMDGKIIRITISGGLTECGGTMSAKDVMTAADAMLYQAKNGGRNRIAYHGQQ